MERAVRILERDGERDAVAVEEPLEIRVDGDALAVTMRTPGEDDELALGFLYGEGLIDGPRAVGNPDLAANVEDVAVHAGRLPDGPTLARELLSELPGRLEQPAFARTGGMHATGLFTFAGRLLLAREDVGRHNAMDKAVG